MQTIGERLEEARKKKGISIREAAEATKIRGDYLQKFESNQFDIGLTEIYTRGFLRTYANFLKVPADRILADYSALGRGESRTRTPSREIYGRMDVSVATANESGGGSAEESSAPAPESRSASRPPHPRPSQPRHRTGTSLPTGPDPAVVFRYVKWGGIALVVVVAIIVLWSLIGGRSSSPAPATTNTPASSAPAATTRAANERTITLVGLDVVQVRVTRKEGDTEGATLFNSVLRAGQREVVSFAGPIYISYSAGENLEIELNGRRFNATNTSDIHRGPYRIALE